MTTPEQVPAISGEPSAADHERLLADLSRALGPRIDEGLARILPVPVTEALRRRPAAARQSGPTASAPRREPGTEKHAALIADLHAALPVAEGLAAILDAESGHADLTAQLGLGVDTVRGLAGILHHEHVHADQPDNAGPDTLLPDVEMSDRTATHDLERLQAAPAPQRLLLRVAGPHRHLADAMQELRNIIDHLTKAAPPEPGSPRSTAEHEIVLALTRQRMLINNAATALADALPGPSSPVEVLDPDDIIHMKPEGPEEGSAPGPANTTPADAPDEQGDIEKLRSRGRLDVAAVVAHLDVTAPVAHLLAGLAEAFELRNRAERGDSNVKQALIQLLIQQGEEAESMLRERAVGGDSGAAVALAQLLAELGKLAELHVPTDVGVLGAVAVDLAWALEEAQSMLRERAVGGDSDAPVALVLFLAELGEIEEAMTFLRGLALGDDLEVRAAVIRVLVDRGLIAEAEVEAIQHGLAEGRDLGTDIAGEALSFERDAWERLLEDAVPRPEDQSVGSPGQLDGRRLATAVRHFRRSADEMALLNDRLRSETAALGRSDRQRCMATVSAVASRLEHAWAALSDFRGADLRAVDIPLDDLDGVEWTDSTATVGETQWPPLLREAVIEHSVPGDLAGTGVFIVRYGAMAGAAL